MNRITWPVVALIAIAAFSAVATFGICSIQDEFAWPSSFPEAGGWTAYPPPSAQAERCHNYWLSSRGMEDWRDLLDSVYMLNEQLDRFPASSNDHLNARSLSDAQLGLVSQLDSELQEFCWWQ